MTIVGDGGRATNETSDFEARLIFMFLVSMTEGNDIGRSRIVQCLPAFVQNAEEPNVMYWLLLLRLLFLLFLCFLLGLLVHPVQMKASGELRGVSKRLRSSPIALLEVAGKRSVRVLSHNSPVIETLPVPGDLEDVKL